MMVVSQEEGEEGEEGEERVVPYDHLILTTGLQFTHPPLPTDTSGDIPLVYDANDGLGVSEWAQKHLQPQGPLTHSHTHTLTPSHTPSHRPDLGIWQWY